MPFFFFLYLLVFKVRDGEREGFVFYFFEGEGRQI